MASLPKHAAVEQAGLEVAPEQPWLEARTFYESDAKEAVLVSKYSPDPEYAYPKQLPMPPTDTASAPELVTEQKAGRRKRTLLIVGILVALAVILAAVLGGVLGSRAGASTSPGGSQEGSRDGGSDSNAPTTTGAGSTKPSASTSARPQTIRQGSSLSVTGWRNVEGVVEKYLFFQDPQDGLRYTHCKGAKSGNADCWEPPVSFNSFAKPDARLSASILIYGTRHSPQVELFYTGKSSRLLGTNFNEVNVPPIAEDSVNLVEITTGLNTSLSSYWPWTIQQDSGGGLLHVRNRVRGDTFSPASEWDVNRINVTALAGSSLAIVPMSTNMSRIALKGGYGVFYQTADGRLSVSITDLKSPELDPTYPLSWPTDLPLITLPKKAPIAAFSVARGDAEQRVNTYVLYIDSSSNIHMLYTDASGGSPVWYTAQPEALRGVDADSSLTCLTMGTSGQGASGGAILLESGSEDIMSLASSLYDYQYQNGRRYHAYRAGKYLLPNGASEQERLDMTPRRILDIGTGTGVWAIEIANAHPSSRVIGTDLSPIQPAWTPPNASFQVDDATEPWTFQPESFGFIHARTLGGAARGQIEIAEGRANFWCDDGSLGEDSATYKWLSEFRRLSEPLQFDVAPKLGGLLREAGFEDVEFDQRVIPLGPWPREKALKEVGRWFKVQFLEGALEAYTLALFAMAGWSGEEVKTLLEKARGELAEGRMHLYTYA
ncbi:hypothetical protein OQA88_5986 [Cercophora sp. LCS_1]